jgi:hypothetical protein
VEDVGVVIDQGSIAPGDMITDPAVLGSLRFIEGLPVARRTGLTLHMEGVGLVANLGTYRIRLGRPVDMALKASVLEGLLDTGLPPGATISLIAPMRPAVGQPST